LKHHITDRQPTDTQPNDLRGISHVVVHDAAHLGGWGRVDHGCAVVPSPPQAAVYAPERCPRHPTAGRGLFRNRRLLSRTLLLALPVLAGADVPMRMVAPRVTAGPPHGSGSDGVAARPIALVKPNKTYSLEETR
jgi:hypothetical protein